MPFNVKVLKYMLLVTGLTSEIFSVFTFVVVPSISEIVCTASNILLRTNLASKCVNNRLFVIIKLMIYLKGLMFN